LTQDNESVIKFTDVSKKYKDVLALQGVSFSIKKGDIFGYLGQNGAGKTTTLKILVGLIQDYSGEVTINNKSIKGNLAHGNLIGYLPQDVGFQEWRTVNHALSTFGKLSGMTKSELVLRIPEVLELVDLIQARKRKIKHLSGGMQQKLKLAQALLHKPQILVLDEPMSGLDPSSRWQMKNIIKKLANEEVTIIFSSHILGDVEDIANTIGIIKDGVIVKLGNPQDMQKELTKGDAVSIIGERVAEKAAQIKALPFVSSTEQNLEDSSKLTVIFTPETDINTALIKLMEFFANNQIVITNFNYLKPSLEQMYLQYVNGGSTV